MDRFNRDLLDVKHLYSFKQVLSISTKNGRFMSFMMQLAWVHDVWMDYVLYLSSMMEMCIADARDASRTSTFKTKALLIEHLSRNAEATTL